MSFSRPVIITLTSAPGLNVEAPVALATDNSVPGFTLRVNDLLGDPPTNEVPALGLKLNV